MSCSGDAAKESRKASQTPHQRELEAVVDEFTAALRDGTAMEWFERVAAERLRHAECRLARVRLDRELRAAQETIRQLAGPPA